MLTRFSTWLARRRLQNIPFYERTEYSFDGVTIRARDPLGSDQSVPLTKLTEIGVETNSLGPFAEDVFWLLQFAGGALRIPQSSPVFGVLLKAFETFPGFDFEPFLQSMGSTSDAYFSCWKAPAEPTSLPR